MATTWMESYNTFIHGGDPYIRQLFFLRSMYPMLTIISSYVIFVTYLGPALMRQRKPFQLRKLIIFYNFALVTYYSYFLIRGVSFVYNLGLSMVCDSTLDSNKSPFIAAFYFHGYVLYVVRYIELIDTVFLVLSKKFKMITPLHVFHHSCVPIVCHFGFRSERSGYLSFFMAINSIVHIIMYTYYALAALGPKYQKYIWWKKYLTTLQISQFFVITVYLLIVTAFGCVTSKFLFGASVFMCVLFFFWFILYYRQTYLKKCLNPQTKLKNGSTNGCHNGSSNQDPTSSDNKSK